MNKTKTKILGAFFLVLWPLLAVCQDMEIYVSDAGEFQDGPWTIFKYDANG